ncbi:MAG: dTDP-4-dehydrorhamnose 3,5-epimerase [Pseudomonadota bacterium]|nr:dTDP-4-dehydrorhamnose 3,5-epimerase [Pseudomonadota bacterium]
MQIEQTAIPGVLIFTPERYGDDRGFFAETWNRRQLADAGVDVEFVQDNHSVSAAAGTLRGLHMQTPPFAQDKLVRCGRGRFLDVAVDIRVGSPTFGRWVGVELSAENGKQTFLPHGILHGVLTLEPDTEVIYKVSNYFAPDCSRAVRFDDPEIGIEWGLSGQPILSSKDAAAPLLRDLDNPFTLETIS